MRICGGHDDLVDVGYVWDSEVVRDPEVDG